MSNWYSVIIVNYHIPSYRRRRNALCIKDLIIPDQIKLTSTQLNIEKNNSNNNNIMNVITSYLVRVHYMSNRSPVIKEIYRQIDTYLHQRYMAPLSCWACNRLWAESGSLSTESWCLLWMIFDKVVSLLNNLRSKDHIRARPLHKMMRNEIEFNWLIFISFQNRD